MFKPFYYLGFLLISLTGCLVLDYRYRLVVFYDWRAALRTVVLGLLFFLAWDIAGVGLGIFYAGDAPYMTHLMVLPEVPIEEFCFLVFFSYLPLLLWEGLAYYRQRSPRV